MKKIIEQVQDNPEIEEKIYQAVHDWTGSSSERAFKELNAVYDYLPKKAKEYTGILYRGIKVSNDIIKGLLDGQTYYLKPKKATSWTPELRIADNFGGTSIVIKTKATRKNVFLNLDEIGYRQFDESEVILYGTGLKDNKLSLKNIELINGEKVSEILKNSSTDSIMANLEEVSKAEKYLRELNVKSEGRFGMLKTNYDWLIDSFLNNEPINTNMLSIYRLKPTEKKILIHNAKFWADKILAYPNRKAVLSAYKKGDIGPSYGMFDIVKKHLEESYVPLNESKIDYILQNKKASEKIAEKYCIDNNISLKEPVETIAAMALKQCEKLPYTNKYMVWLMKYYIQNKFKIPEDLSKLNSELEQFSKISHKLEKTNINDYSWDEFLSVLPKLDDIHTSKEEERIAKAGAEKVFEDENWLVIHPKTEDAACYYGKGTRWCTAAKENNYFDVYNQDGPLYIFINKKSPNEKYQLHVETNSFMNAKDEPIEYKDAELFYKDSKLIEFLKSIITLEFNVKNGSVQKASLYELYEVLSSRTYEHLLGATTDEFDYPFTFGMIGNNYYKEQIYALFKEKLGIDISYIWNFYGVRYTSQLLNTCKKYMKETDSYIQKEYRAFIFNKLKDYFKGNLKITVSNVPQEYIMFESTITDEIYKYANIIDIFGRFIDYSDIFSMLLRGNNFFIIVDYYMRINGDDDFITIDKCTEEDFLETFNTEKINEVYDKAINEIKRELDDKKVAETIIREIKGL